MKSAVVTLSIPLTAILECLGRYCHLWLKYKHFRIPWKDSSKFGMSLLDFLVLVLVPLLVWLAGLQDTIGRIRFLFRCIQSKNYAQRNGEFSVNKEKLRRRRIHHVDRFETSIQINQVVFRSNCSFLFHQYAILVESY